MSFFQKMMNEKLSRKKSGDKLTAAMIQSGFSYKQIHQAQESLKENQ